MYLVTINALTKVAPLRLQRSKLPATIERNGRAYIAHTTERKNH